MSIGLIGANIFLSVSLDSLNTNYFRRSPIKYFNNSFVLEKLKTPTISKGRKLLAALPFIIATGVLINSWHEFYIGEFVPFLKHYITLAFMAINWVLFFIRFKPALLLNGIILAFASFSLLCFYTYIASSITLFGITIPFEGWSFLILIFYLAINGSILINWQLDTRDIKPID